MIVKSMSRKNSSYSQLLRYMENGRHDKDFTFSHNVISKESDEIINEFNKNAEFLKYRKNGVYMYHEILSITRNNTLSYYQQKNILRAIADKYIDKRCVNSMVYAVLHDDKSENLHYHLMISSNELGEEKKLNLYKSEFDNIKKELENYVLKTYPELNQEKIINKPAAEKLSNKGAELKRRTGKTPQRESVKERLKTVFDTAKTKQEFFELLEKHQLEIYVRGKTISVLDLIARHKHNKSLY